MSLNFEGKAPDLVFYFLSKSGKEQQQEVGFIISRQVLRIITSDKEGKHVIGSYTTDDTILTNNDKEGEFKFNNVSVSLLSLGTFISQSSGDKLTLDENGNYILIGNTQSVKTITSGNGDFIGATGYMVVISDNTPVRKVLVYFTHI